MARTPSRTRGMPQPSPARGSRASGDGRCVERFAHHRRHPEKHRLGRCPFGAQLVSDETRYEHHEQRHRPRSQRLPRVGTMKRTPQKQAHIVLRAAGLDTLPANQAVGIGVQFCRVEQAGATSRVEPITMVGRGAASVGAHAALFLGTVSHGEHRSAPVRSQQQTDRTEPSAEGPILEEEPDQPGGGQQGPKEHRRVGGHAVQIRAGDQHLDHGVEDQNQHSAAQPSAKAPLANAQPPAESFGAVGHQFQRTDGTPCAAKRHGRPDHGRPPQPPDGQIDEIRLRVQLAGHVLRRETSPPENGNINKPGQRDSLKNVRKTTPEDQRSNRSPAEKIAPQAPLDRGRPGVLGKPIRWFDPRGHSLGRPDAPGATGDKEAGNRSTIS